ncbi:radial spoke head 1 homolog [Cimex lectularius]|uniref:MORN repeat-containing protein 5 n=1 Tax=Cimex lectularius TaxID=79782 RepID=A0A8I6RQR5_CIMLE|nr:radial spoke head 1 homolog [Cimex lectularius]
MSEPSEQAGSEKSESENKDSGGRKKSVRKKSVKKASIRKKSVKGGSGKRMSMKAGGGGKSKLGLSKEIAEDQNPFLKSGQGVFKFKNHDRYIGEFQALWPDELCRQGLGIYSTWDGLVYKGRWSDDYLINGIVQWPCGQRYTGELSMGKYSGSGRYYIPGRGELIANFENNLPKGKVAFIDEAGLIYTGEVIEGEEVLTLIPVNHYLPINKDELVVRPQPPPPNPKKSKKK